MAIHSFDIETPIGILRDEFGWETTDQNRDSLIIVLCSRVAMLESRIAKLEKAQRGNDRAAPELSMMQNGIQPD